MSTSPRSNLHNSLAAVADARTAYYASSVDTDRQQQRNTTTTQSRDRRHMGGVDDDGGGGSSRSVHFDPSSMSVGGSTTPNGGRYPPSQYYRPSEVDSPTTPDRIFGSAMGSVVGGGSMPRHLLFGNYDGYQQQQYNRREENNSHYQDQSSMSNNYESKNFIEMAGGANSLCADCQPFLGTLRVKLQSVERNFLDEIATLKGALRESDRERQELLSHSEMLEAENAELRSSMVTSEGRLAEALAALDDRQDETTLAHHIRALSHTQVQSTQRVGGEQRASDLFAVESAKRRTLLSQELSHRFAALSVFHKQQHDIAGQIFIRKRQEMALVAKGTFAHIKRLAAAIKKKDDSRYVKSKQATDFASRVRSCFIYGRRGDDGEINTNTYNGGVYVSTLLSESPAAPLPKWLVDMSDSLGADDDDYAASSSGDDGDELYAAASSGPTAVAGSIKSPTTHSKSIHHTSTTKGVVLLQSLEKEEHSSRLQLRIADIEWFAKTLLDHSKVLSKQVVKNTTTTSSSSSLKTVPSSPLLTQLPPTTTPTASEDPVEAREISVLRRMLMSAREELSTLKIKHEEVISEQSLLQERIRASAAEVENNREKWEASDNELEKVRSELGAVQARWTKKEKELLYKMSVYSRTTSTSNNVAGVGSPAVTNSNSVLGSPSIAATLSSSAAAAASLPAPKHTNHKIDDEAVALMQVPSMPNTTGSGDSIDGDVGPVPLPNPIPTTEQLSSSTSSPSEIHILNSNRGSGGVTPQHSVTANTGNYHHQFVSHYAHLLEQQHALLSDFVRMSGGAALGTFQFSRKNSTAIIHPLSAPDGVMSMSWPPHGSLHPPGSPLGRGGDTYGGGAQATSASGGTQQQPSGLPPRHPQLYSVSNSSIALRPQTEVSNSASTLTGISGGEGSGSGNNNTPPALTQAPLDSSLPLSPHGDPQPHHTAVTNSPFFGALPQLGGHYSAHNSSLQGSGPPPGLMDVFMNTSKTIMGGGPAGCGVGSGLFPSMSTLPNSMSQPCHKNSISNNPPGNQGGSGGGRGSFLAGAFSHRNSSLDTIPPHLIEVGQSQIMMSNSMVDLSKKVDRLIEYFLVPAPSTTTANSPKSSPTSLRPAHLSSTTLPEATAPPPPSQHLLINSDDGTSTQHQLQSGGGHPPHRQLSDENHHKLLSATCSPLPIGAADFPPSHLNDICEIDSQFIRTVKKQLYMVGGSASLPPTTSSSRAPSPKNSSMNAVLPAKPSSTAAPAPASASPPPHQTSEDMAAIKLGIRNLTQASTHNSGILAKRVKEIKDMLISLSAPPEPMPTRAAETSNHNTSATTVKSVTSVPSNTAKPTSTSTTTSKAASSVLDSPPPAEIVVRAPSSVSSRRPTQAPLPSSSQSPPTQQQQSLQVPAQPPSTCSSQNHTFTSSLDMLPPPFKSSIDTHFTGSVDSGHRISLGGADADLNLQALPTFSRDRDMLMGAHAGGASVATSSLHPRTGSFSMGSDSSVPTGAKSGATVPGVSDQPLSPTQCSINRTLSGGQLSSYNGSFTDDDHHNIGAAIESSSGKQQQEQTAAPSLILGGSFGALTKSQEVETALNKSQSQSAWDEDDDDDDTDVDATGLSAADRAMSANKMEPVPAARISASTTAYNSGASSVANRTSSASLPAPLVASALGGSSASTESGSNSIKIVTSGGSTPHSTTTFPVSTTHRNRQLPSSPESAPIAPTTKKVAHRTASSTSIVGFTAGGVGGGSAIPPSRKNIAAVELDDWDSSPAQSVSPNRNSSNAFSVFQNDQAAVQRNSYNSNGSSPVMSASTGSNPNSQQQPPITSPITRSTSPSFTGKVGTNPFSSESRRSRTNEKKSVVTINSPKQRAASVGGIGGGGGSAPGSNASSRSVSPNGSSFRLDSPPIVRTYSPPRIHRKASSVTIQSDNGGGGGGSARSSGGGPLSPEATPAQAPAGMFRSTSGGGSSSRGNSFSAQYGKQGGGGGTAGSNMSSPRGGSSSSGAAQQTASYKDYLNRSGNSSPGTPGHSARGGGTSPAGGGGGGAGSSNAAKAQAYGAKHISGFIHKKPEHSEPTRTPSSAPHASSASSTSKQPASVASLYSNASPRRATPAEAEAQKPKPKGFSVAALLAAPTDASDDEYQ